MAASDLGRTGEMGISFDADLPVPLLMLHADLRGFYRMLGADPTGPLRSFNDFSYERLEHAGQRADIHRMVLRDSLHSGLTDTPLFMRRPLRDGLFGTAPTQVLVVVPNELVLAFFDHYLRGRANGFPQAQYARHGQCLAPYDNSAVRQWWLGKPAAERTQPRQRIEAMKAAVPSR